MINEIRLGGLVLDMREPMDESCPHFPVALIPDEDYTCGSFKDIQISDKDERKTRFSAALTKLFTFGTHSSHVDDEKIKTKVAKTFRLKNHESYLQRQLEDDSGLVVEWVLSQRRKKRDIYMIVSYHTVMDVEVNEYQERDTGVETTVTIPIAEAIHPGSSMNPVGQAMDTSFDTKVDRKRQRATSFLAPGERIVGVGYRKLLFKELKPGTVQSYLNLNCLTPTSSFTISLKNKKK